MDSQRNPGWCTIGYCSRWILGESVRTGVLILTPLESIKRLLYLHATVAMKTRKYDQRIREVEHASFTPLILSCTGGLGPQATTSYKRLASLLSAKWNQAYSLTIMWLRCRLAYSLLRSSVMCIRGARSHLGHFDLVSREALLLAQ